MIIVIVETMKETNTDLILIMLVITLVGVVILRKVDGLFAKSKHRLIINMMVVCILINILIFVFLYKSFRKTKFRVGPPGPQGNRGSVGYEGLPDRCSVCDKPSNSVGYNANKEKRLSAIIPEKPILAKQPDPWKHIWGKPVRIYKTVNGAKLGLVMIDISGNNKTYSAIFSENPGDIMIMTKDADSGLVHIHNRIGKNGDKVLSKMCHLAISQTTHQNTSATRTALFDCDSSDTPLFIEGTPNQFSISATDIDHYTCHLADRGKDIMFDCNPKVVSSLSVELYKPTTATQLIKKANTVNNSIVSTAINNMSDASDRLLASIGIK